MKSMLWILIFLKFYGLLQSKASEKDPGVSLLRTFYVAYITTASSNEDVGVIDTKLAILRKKYCTPACLARYKVLVKQTDADPILKAQDSYKELISTLKVAKAGVNPKRYMVEYKDINGIQRETRIFIKLRRENGLLKINDFK